MTDLTIGTPVTVAYSGAAVIYNVPTDCTIQFEAWGGGGGGGCASGSATEQDGGAGGAVAGYFAAQSGWQIKVEVGQGGRAGAAGVGGLGGWPDGGNAGIYSTSSIAMGGGGGSTRIWADKQDGAGYVLMAVAGAGGGSLVSRQGGAGGGLQGADGGGIVPPVTNAGTSGPGYGGTQTAGGAGYTAYQNGSYLQGGNGYPSGYSNTTAAAATGGGGGGGYYGGGGAGGVSPSQFGAGGGGSSYVASDVKGGCFSGLRWKPSQTANMPAGVAAGGISALPGSAQPGGNGAAYLNILSSTPSAATLPLTESYTGGRVDYVVGDNGVLDIFLWGGGGSGGYYSSVLSGHGGPGGFTRVQVSVSAGDYLSLEVGQGAPAATTTSGSTGGWPDGGYGGRAASSGSYGLGGGGGSTRLYVNGVLGAVAGAGGGHAFTYVGGAGGGTTGGTALGYNNNNTPGGTQSAGGTTKAAYLYGGNSTTGQTATSLQSMGGGGGGYYGGGSYAGTPSNGAYPGGGGGSSYIGTAVSGGYTTIGDATNNVPGETTNMPAGTGAGGVAGPSNGGSDGAVYIQTVDTDLPTDFTPITNSSWETVYYAQSAGTLTIKLWGAGGGGGWTSTTSYAAQGGAGGYVEAQILLALNDKVSVRPGQGGQPPSSATLGGPAAAPDGGFGGSYSTANYAGGSGGGSSRLFINDQPFMIAGAGGGGRGSGNSGTYQPQNGGAGGGSTGGNGYQGATIRAYGGSQTAGGTSAYAASYGGYLQGGAGGYTFQATSSVLCGGGGGGGYYGGAGGGTGSITTGGGGGGGSSFVSTDDSVIYSESLQGGQSGVAAALPPNQGDSEYIAGVGVGGLTQTAGGDGLVVLAFSAGISGNVNISDTIGPLNLTAPTGLGGYEGHPTGDLATLTLTSVDGGFTFFGDLSTIDLTSPSAGAAELALGEGPIGTITLYPELLGQPTADAFINIPISDTDLMLNPDSYLAGSATGAANPVKAMPGPITLAVPRLVFPGQVDDSTLETVPLTLTAPEADAANTYDAFGSIGTLNFSISKFDSNTTDFDAFVSGGITLSQIFTITLHSPTATVLDAFYGDAQAEFSADSPVTFTVPSVTVADGSAHPSGDIGTISFTDIPEFTYEAFPEFFDNDLTFSLYKANADQREAYGNAVAIAQNNGESDIPANRFMVRLVLTNPNGSAVGYGAASGAMGGPLSFRQPGGDYIKEATVLASIIPAYIRIVPGVAFAGPSNAAVAGGDLDYAFISLEAPEGYVFVDSLGWAPLRLKRSMTPGAKPTSLEIREIAINEMDGILYTRDAAGNVQGTPLADIQAGALVPMAGTTGDFLRGDGTYGVIQPTYDKPVRLKIPEQNIALTEAMLGATTTSLISDKVYYHPFFIPKPVRLSNIGVTVQTADDATVYFGICSWDFPQVPDTLVMSSSASTATTGTKVAPDSVVLAPGWYAAMVAVSGSGTPEFVGYEAPIRLSATFANSGDPLADYAGNFNALVTPTSRANTSISFLTADASNV